MESSPSLRLSPFHFCPSRFVFFAKPASLRFLRRLRWVGKWKCVVGDRRVSEGWKKKFAEESFVVSLNNWKRFKFLIVARKNYNKFFFSSALLCLSLFDCCVCSLWETQSSVRKEHSFIVDPIPMLSILYILCESCALTRWRPSAKEKVVNLIWNVMRAATRICIDHWSSCGRRTSITSNQVHSVVGHFHSASNVAPSNGRFFFVRADEKFKWFVASYSCVQQTPAAAWQSHWQFAVCFLALFSLFHYIKFSTNYKVGNKACRHLSLSVKCVGRNGIACWFTGEHLFRTSIRSMQHSKDGKEKPNWNQITITLSVSVFIILPVPVASQKGHKPDIFHSSNEKAVMRARGDNVFRAAAINFASLLCNAQKRNSSTAADYCTLFPIK